MRSIRHIILFTCVVAVVSSCAGMSGRSLRTTPVDDPTAISGNYTLIVIGGTHGEDVKNIAVLDLEGDSFTFQPYVSEYDYYKQENLEAQEALKRAVHAVRWYHAFSRTKIRSIVDDAGKIIGYEIRPLYRPLEFGVSDILDTHYTAKDNTVFIYISLKPFLENRIFREHKGHDD
jgi:hypothetical protein